MTAPEKIAFTIENGNGHHPAAHNIQRVCDTTYTRAILSSKLLFSVILVCETNDCAGFFFLHLLFPVNRTTDSQHHIETQL